MTSWDVIVSISSKACAFFGFMTRRKREARGAVLRDLTAFHSIVSQVCSGDTSSGGVAGHSFEEFDVIVETIRRTLNEQSQWVGGTWLQNVEQILGLGKRAVARYHFADPIRGPISGRALD